MRSRGTGRNRHVDTIVDENRHGQLRDQLPREVMEHTIRRLLEPQLDRRHATAHRRCAERHDIAIGQEEIVGHQQKPEGGS